MVVLFSSCPGKEIQLQEQQVFHHEYKFLAFAKYLYFLQDSPTEVTQNPMPKEDEVNWILDEVSHYLSSGNAP
jgi:hypothetical protein